MRHCGRPFRRRPEATPAFGRVLLLAGMVSLVQGCVSLGAHEQVVDDRDALRADKARLEERVRLLEASTRSLDGERVALIDQMEDLRQQEEEAQKHLRRLRKAEAELSERVGKQETELQSRGQEISRLRSTYEGLVSDLEAELADGQIEIQQLRDGLQLNMAQEVLFSSGSAEVSRSGQAVLSKVADRVGDAPYIVVVQGHTDDVPIATGRFPSNWELAGARASRVVRILARDGIPPDRLSAVSFGEHSPRAENDSPKGRARNRRIEITLKPMDVPSVAGSASEDSGADDEAAQPADPAAAPQ